jgi:hypothetical protein
MEQWEYLPTFIEANARDKETKAFLKENLPSSKRTKRYMPEAMMPQLNELGEQGWELIHMEPVAAVGNKGDILFENIGRRWSNVYFCVFKRRKISLGAMAQDGSSYVPIPLLDDNDTDQPPLLPDPIDNERDV